VTAIWLLPFFPSPLRDDGYDIADYTGVHPAYGTIDDFRELLDEAHRRGLRVIIELVLNHTSDQHPWFQRARQAPPGSSERDFYVWSDTAERYGDARVIFQDYEQSNWTWDPVADAYFWHRFYSHQPDLNYDHPPVREAMLDAVDFWLEMGVDGLRLDAVPYLIEREATTSENLPETHAFLKELRAHVDERFDDRMLLAEANQWPEDAVAYFGDGDECHMAFHFPLMPRLFMSVQTEDRLPVQDILSQTPPIPDSAQWALFLRNHDELTLEMVTDEERLYMYQAYAPDQSARINLGIRRRLAPLLGNSRRRIELMNALLCSLPGTPVLYYGDEIGMGDNIYLGDRDGVRTPMQWSGDRNAGFSRATPQQLFLPLIVDYEYHHEAVHVEAQEESPHSLLAFMRRLLDVRGRTRAFGSGSIEMLHPDNHHVLAFIRELGDETILVVANLSRFSQPVELDLSRYRGLAPVELFGRIRFWEIDDRPYPLTLGPHAFHWFRIMQATERLPGSADGVANEVPVIDLPGQPVDVLAGNARNALERVLPEFLKGHAWFSGATGTALGARLLDVVAAGDADRPAYIAPVRVTFSDRDPERYLLALTIVPDDDAADAISPEAIVARLRPAGGEEALLIDVIEAGLIGDALRWIARESEAPSRGGAIVLQQTGEGGRIESPRLDAAEPVDALGNNDVFLAERLVIKFLRRLNEGINPEWEIGAALTDQGFDHAPTVLGQVQYRHPDHGPMTIAVLQREALNEGHAWDATAAFLDDYLARAAGEIVVPRVTGLAAADLAEAAGEASPDSLAELLAPSLAFFRLLGRRTAALHHALSTVPDGVAFSPEPYTPYGVRSLYQSMRGLTARATRSLRQTMPRLGTSERKLAAAIVEREGEIYNRFRTLSNIGDAGDRIRCHGDFHLGQVLLAEGDIIFVDFEGEPGRFLEERRLKITPLRDIADLLQSIRLVGMEASARHQAVPERSAEGASEVDALTSTWIRLAGGAFLGAYLDAAAPDGLLPASDDDRDTLLDALLLERAIGEVWQAALHDPDRLTMPLERLARMLDAG
jgi:maltose alpha-D-glucosyltransferase / alpha-amylase